MTLLATETIKAPTQVAAGGSRRGRQARPPGGFHPVAENRAVFRVRHLADYRYAAPAHGLVTRLRLAPPPLRGGQRRLDWELQTAPLPVDTRHELDAFGNAVIELTHERVEQHLTIAAELVVETRCRYNEAGAPVPMPIPRLPSEDLAAYKAPTARTLPDAGMMALARRLRAAHGPGTASAELFRAVCARVHARMEFAVGVTNVDTTAAAAWGQRRGVCQDYSQVALAVCRLCGLPARYVSGYVYGAAREEGVMHAWVEAYVALPTDGAPAWYAYDPTYDKWVDENYVAVAAGRDYADITPTSGTYYGGSSFLSHRSPVERLEHEVRLL